MADDKQVNGAGQVTREQAAKLVAVMTGAVESQAALMIALGVALPDVVNILMNVGCKLVSHIQPAQLRMNVASEISRNIVPLVDGHVVQNATTPGGVILPGRTQ